MDNFDEGIWCYLSVQQAVTQMVGDGGERQLQVVMGVVVKEPHFVPPVLELVK